MTCKSLKKLPDKEVYKYHEYELEPRCELNPKTNKWSTSIGIFRNDTFCDFYTNDTHNTQEEANAFSVRYGMQIIDDESPDINLDF